MVAVLPGAGGGRSLLAFAHPDSEPVADTDQWRHDPFAGEIEDGRMYGWGIADDLSGVVAMICALDAVQAAGLSLSGPVICASAVSKRRAQGIYAVLERGYQADAAIYLHPAESGAGLGDIKARASGLMYFRITVSGQPPDTSEPTHTPFYHLAVNPIDKAWLVYRALAELAEERAQRVRITRLTPRSAARPTCTFRISRPGMGAPGSCGGGSDYDGLGHIPAGRRHR